MRASNWIIGGFSVVLWATGGLWADDLPEESTISARIAAQQTRLSQIEELAAREREQIDLWYKQRRTELVQSLSRQAAAQISYPYRVRWVEYMMMHRGLPHAEAYFDASNYGLVLTPEAHRLREAMDHEYFLTEMAHLLVSEEFQEKLTQIVQERLDAPLLPLLREQTRSLLDVVTQVRRELTTELRHLEYTRTARLDAAMEWERELKEQVHGILEYLRRRETREPDFGVVESIGYFPRSGYFCMIEGVDRIVETGDTIGGIRVLSIHPQKVEFAKDGTTWAQQLGAPAQPYWQ